METKTAAHTPSPWKLTGKTIDDIVGIVAVNGKCIVDRTEFQDAAFIVRCVNNFEDVLSCLKIFCVEHTKPCGCENCRIIARAKREIT
jgi:hypothetical protein